MSRTTEIKLNVALDSNNLPETITWHADDTDEPEAECKAFVLSLWDKQSAASMRLELWNKDMLVDEMKQFIHQTMLGLSETYEKATGDAKLANDVRDFCYYFAEKSGIITPQQ
jgi:gliding motility-associated protein GldC